MKTGFKKILSMLLALTMLLSMTGLTAFAVDAEPLPTSLEAPSIIVYDSGYRTLDMEVKVEHPTSIMDVYEKSATNCVYNEDTYECSSDYGEYYLYDAVVQIDWKLDDGDWQYTAEWDEYAWECAEYEYFNGAHVGWTYVASPSAYSNSTLEQALIDQECLIETTDGSSTYYRFDEANHSISFRARYFFMFESDTGSANVNVLSDWSEVAVYGRGSVQENSIPMTLSAPTLANLEIYDTYTYYMVPMVQFDVYPGSDILDALMWYEEYDTELESSDISLVLEASLDPNFGPEAVVIDRDVSQYSAIERKNNWDMMFYDLWWDLPTSDQEAFVWNGETVYLRAKWVNEREISGQWSEIESPYSNVISIQGPQIAAYTISVSHGSYGFDSYYDAQWNEKITAGKEYDYIYCHPLEGCYVDTVTINGQVMYDYDDEATHELLYWNYNRDLFHFHDEDNYADRDLTIEITYAGTPTEMYGITTEWGNGGYLELDYYSNYVSWEDNSLVVYHGATPGFEIIPYTGCVIDTVLIDGVENAQAKEDGYYQFPAITDNSHSIEVTFKREAYAVNFWADSRKGYIESDYDWYNGNAGYVRIGDDVTFTFGPNADHNGNYYEITQVWIDGVLNEEAKATGSYTFENIQAGHSIDVHFSDAPVVTHDVTATSGENGSVSPEGVVHVREGSDKYFYFYPDEGYEVDKVFVDNVEITNLATKEYYIVSNVTADRTIHVTFKKLPVRYNVNMVVSGHNTAAHAVSPVGTTPVWEGESFTVTFTPFAGYEVEKVLVNGSLTEADGTYSIAAVDADTTIEIFFKIKSYTVTFVDYNGTELKNETVEHGAQATAPADPTREHYVFTGWDTSFSDITTNVTIRATYKPAEYTVRFLGWNGSLLKTETVTYNANATAPEAPEREGYNFSRWSHSFTNVSSNLDVTAVYEKKEYTVTFVDSDDSVLSTQTVKHGEAATAPEAPTKEGYTFVGWDNTNYGNVTQAMTIKAMYVEGTGVTYTVTARALGTTGAVSPTGVSTVQENSTLTLNFTPDELSKIVKVVVDGVEIDVCSTYTFANITANHTIDVYFAPTAVINVGNTDSAQGTASGHYDLIGDNVVYVLEVTPAEGYELDGIYVDGVKIDVELTDDGYVIRDLDEDMNLDVRFKAITTGDGDEDDDGDNTGDGGNDNTGDGTGGNTGDGTGDNTSDGSENIDSPQTGDNTQLALWFSLMFLSCAGIIATTMYGRKRRNEAN